MTNTPTTRIPASRVMEANHAPVSGDGRYVLYWMIAARRRRSNFALQRAVEWCRHLGQPLVVLEALRCDYRWASDRLHAFVLDGMAENARAFDVPGVRYYPYVEAARKKGRGLLAALAERASVVVTDEFPSFFLPRMVAAAAARLRVRLETVDGNGIFPLRSTDKAYPTAYAFRRFVHGALGDHLGDRPVRDPLGRIDLPEFGRLPSGVARRWPEATAMLLSGDADALAGLPIAHGVAAGPARGGATTARRVLRRFVSKRLERYGAERNEPEADVTSELSPYLHFGHISAHDVFDAVATGRDWDPGRLGADRGSRRAWNLGDAAGGFVDQLITWRELGYNMCHHRNDYAEYSSLPDWARQTLADHAKDRREPCYPLEAFEAAETHDELWNAAQRQLVREGRIHNYMRMVWGKKILEWTRDPETALDVMVELNNKYALDGRNPNSYSGICWILGRYDRPWGPERAVFGKVRYMSSANTARKFAVRRYRERYQAGTGRRPVGRDEQPTRLGAAPESDVDRAELEKPGRRKRRPVKG